jgi:hypothetical protein
MEVRRRNLPPEAYPFVLRAFDANGKEVWHRTVELPDGLASVYVPPLAQLYGPVTIEAEFATGEIIREP